MYWYNPGQRWQALVVGIALLVTVLFAYWMGQQASPLTSKEIVAFETALRADTANAYLQQWQAPDLRKEKLLHSIYLDYGFIFLYTITLFLANRFLASLTRNTILQKAGVFFSWLAIPAGICDIMENLFMTQSIHAGATATTAAWAYYMAVTKFSLLLICLLFAVFCLIMYVAALFSKRE
jgi:uncharacterized membrane protein